MVFLNKKEQVLEIELTPYGKHLLSKGEFDPIYYEFYDDDIVYDSEYLGFSEKQEEIQKRIKETPRTKVQYTFEPAYLRYKEYLKLVKERGTLNVPVLEKRRNFSFSTLPLANSSNIEEKYPAVNIKFYNTKILSTGQPNSQGLSNIIKEIVLEPSYYNINVRKKIEGEESLEEDPTDSEAGNGDVASSYSLSQESLTDIYMDNGEIAELKMQFPYILIDAQEIGIDTQNDNFEFFLYYSEYDAKLDKEVEKQVYFVKQPENIVNNILLDNEELDTEQIEITKEFVEYYFSILTDKEIPENILCQFLEEEEINRLNAVEGYEINCADQRLAQKLLNSELFVSREELIKIEEDC